MKKLSEKLVDLRNSIINNSIKRLPLELEREIVDMFAKTGKQAREQEQEIERLRTALRKIDAFYQDDLGAEFLDPNHPQNIARKALQNG